MPFGFTSNEWDSAKVQAINAMVDRARVRGMISYSELTAKITTISIQPDSAALAGLLDEISVSEDAEGRGMLSVIVVHKVGDMEPGKGFFKLATKLGKSTADPTSFWVSELHRVHAQWR